MTKQHKIYAGVALTVVAIGGYMYWKKNQKPATTAKFVGDKKARAVNTTVTCPDGCTWDAPSQMCLMYDKNGRFYICG